MLHLPTGCLQSELTKFLPFKYRVGQNIALDASSANRMPAVRAAHSSPDLSAMKSDFKCNKWIFSLMNAFWQVNRTRIHSVIHGHMNDKKLKSTYITLSTALWCTMREEFTIHVYLSEILSKSMLYEYFNHSTEYFVRNLDCCVQG